MCSRSLFRLVVAGLTLVLAVPLWFSPASAAPPPLFYAVPADLQVKPDAYATYPYGLNASKQAAGFFISRLSDGNSQWSAAVWDPDGEVNLIGTLGGSNSYAIDINDAGHAVGTSQIDSVHPEHAFMWDPVNGMTDLGGLGGPDGRANATAINEHDQVAGVSSSPIGDTAVLWDPVAGAIALGMLPGDSGSYASGINDNADVVGISIAPGGDRPFRWNADDGIVALATLGGVGSSIASDINNSGAIVGTSRLPNGQSHAVLWHPDGAITDLGTLGGSTSSASAINEAGQVVGTSDMPGDSVAHGFLWDPVNGMMDIGALSIAPRDNGPSGFYNINDQGDILGDYKVSKKVTKPAIWAPVGSPSVSIGSVSVVEGDSGKRSIQFPVVLSDPSTSTVSVGYSIGDSGSASAGADFVAKSGTVTFTRSATTGLTPTVRYVSITVNSDTALEGDESLVVELSNPSGGLTLGTATGVGTILDDDPGSGLRAGIGDVSVAEGTSGLGNTVKAAVTLSSPAPGPTTLLVTFADVTTTNGVDYKTVKATKLLTFQAGQRQKQVSLKLYPDARVEPDETVSISLSNPSAGLTLDRANGTINILDDD